MIERIGSDDAKAEERPAEKASQPSPSDGSGPKANGMPLVPD